MGIVAAVMTRRRARALRAAVMVAVVIGAASAAGKGLERQAIVWPREEEWVVFVDGARVDVDEASNDLVCDDALERARQLAQSLCATYELRDDNCEASTETVVKAARSTAKGSARGVKVLVDRSISVRVQLREGDGEAYFKPMKVYVDESLDAVVTAFCSDNRLEGTSCTKVANDTLPHFARMKEKVVQSLGRRYEIINAAMSRLRAGTAEQKDVVNIRHNLKAALAVEPNNWKALKLLGEVFGIASSNAWTAAQLEEGNSTSLMLQSLDGYAKALEALGKFETHAEDDWSAPRVELTTERFELLVLKARAAMHLSETESARDMLTSTFSQVKSTIQHAEANAPTTVLDALRKTAVACADLLATLEANVGNAAAAKEAIEAGLKLAPASLETGQHIAREIFAASSLPFVSRSLEEGRRGNTILRATLEALTARLASERPLASGGALYPVLAFYSVYNGLPSEPAAERDLRMALGTFHRVATPSLNYVSPHLRPVGPRGATARPARRPRVGFLSAFWFKHSIGKLLCGAIRELEARGMDVVIVQMGGGRPGRDSSDPCRSMWAGAKQGIVLEVAATADGISASFAALAELRLDVAVFGEVGLALPTYFTAFGRFAPVQIAFWGHPVTPGVGSTVDFAVTSQTFTTRANLAPLAGSESRGVPVCSRELHLAPDSAMVPFAEPVLCFQSSSAYFEPPREPTAAEYASARSTLETALAQAGGHVLGDVNVYYLPHRLMKLHPSMDEALAGILQRDPKGVLVLLRGQETAGTFSVFREGRRKLMARFAEFPVMAGRVAWVPELTLGEFLAMATLATVVLEAFGSFGSGVTALEAFSVGVPLVSFPARLKVGPSAHGLYKQVAAATGLEWVAQELSCLDPQDVECYVDKAVEFASDAQVRRRWRDLMLNNTAARAALFSSTAVVDEWERVLNGLHDNVSPQFEYVDVEEDPLEELSPELLASLGFAKVSLSDESSPSVAEGQAVKQDALFTPHVIVLAHTIKPLVLANSSDPDLS